MRICCFVSHPWADNLHFFAQQLSAAIRKRGLRTWLDENEMLPGQDILTRQHEGIVRESDVFVFVLASAALRSKNCLDELALASAHSKPIVTAMVERCEPPGTIAGSIFVDFTNPLYFNSAADRLVTGATELGTRSSIRRALGNDDPALRSEAIQLLTELGDADAFELVSVHCATELDDTVSQYYPNYFAQVYFQDASQAIGAIEKLKALADSDRPLTARAARLAIQARIRRPPV